MASTLPGSTSPHLHSPSRRSIERSVSPTQNSSARSARRSRTVSFSEDTHSDRHSPPTSPNHPSNLGAASRQGNDEPTASDRPDERDPIGPRNPPSSEPSSSNSSADLKQPWYRRLASTYRSVSLENKGSVARDHLALERTFLAWLRTSLAFASIGIAITQLFRLNTSLADQKQRSRRDLGLDHLDRGYEAGALPLSPLMGASLTPEIYSHIQTLLQQQQAYPIYNPSENSASTLLDQLLRPTEFDSDGAARLRHLGKPLGATFLGISIVILFIGFHRYFESQHWIIRGQFPASRGSVALTGLIAVMLIVASLVVVLVFGPTAYNK
jgi:uncharacterized membrane protein YidH (DUF202 family)